MTLEVWVRVTVFDGTYDVSSCGGVRRWFAPGAPGGRSYTHGILKQTPQREGYLGINLRVAKRRKSWRFAAVQINRAICLE